MDLERNHRSLIERAWALHNNIREEIKCICTCLGRICPKHVAYNGFTEDPYAERKSLIAIREAFQVLGSLLLSLQRMQSQQQMEQEMALRSFEESRSVLLKMITEHHGRTMDLTDEILAFLDNESITFSQNLINANTDKDNHTVLNSWPIHITKVGNRIISFLNSCLQVLSYPWKSQKVSRKVTVFAVIAANVVSVIYFFQMRQQCISKRGETMNQTGTCYRRKDHSHSHSNSMQVGALGLLQNISKSSLDIYCGRG